MYEAKVDAEWWHTAWITFHIPSFAKGSRRQTLRDFHPHHQEKARSLVSRDSTRAAVVAKQMGKVGKGLAKTKTEAEIEESYQAYIRKKNEGE